MKFVFKHQKNNLDFLFKGLESHMYAYTQQSEVPHSNPNYPHSQIPSFYLNLNQTQNPKP